MIETIKSLWNKWENLKTWQQVTLLLPFILLTIGILLYIFSPIKSNNLNREMLKHNKKVVDKQIDNILEKDSKLKVKQNKHKAKRLEVTKKVEKREKETEYIIKKINDADDDIVKLMLIHDSINTRAKRRNR